MNSPKAATDRITQAQLDDIVRRLVQALSPRCIYLFGSHADGQPRPQSDIDVFVVLPGPVPPVPICYGQGCASLRGTYLPIELHFASWDGFNRRRAVTGSLEYDVAGRGKLLYANEN